MVKLACNARQQSAISYSFDSLYQRLREPSFTERPEDHLPIPSRRISSRPCR